MLRRTSLSSAQKHSHNKITVEQSLSSEKLYSIPVWLAFFVEAQNKSNIQIFLEFFFYQNY